MADPWCCKSTETNIIINQFEDSFVDNQKLPDSEQYLKSLGMLKLYWVVHLVATGQPVIYYNYWVLLWDVI